MLNDLLGVIMSETIHGQCQCGETVLVSIGRPDVCRRDGKRPHHIGAGPTVTQFRCRKCQGFLADTCKDAAFGPHIRDAAPNKI